MCYDFVENEIAYNYSGFLFLSNSFDDYDIFHVYTKKYPWLSRLELSMFFVSSNI